jgi:hypothetical protein
MAEVVNKSEVLVWQMKLMCRDKLGVCQELVQLVAKFKTWKNWDTFVTAL